MNILIAVPWDQDTGGVAFVVGHVAEHLRERGHNVLFLHPASRRWPHRKVTRWGFPGYEVNLRSPTSPPSLRARIAYAITYPATFCVLLWMLLRHRIDIVNVHYPSAMFGYFARLRRWLPRLRLVVSLHGTDVLGQTADVVGVDRITTRLLGAADAIVVPSEGFERQCQELLRKIGGRVCVIHNGVSLAEIGEAAGNRLPGTILTVASLDIKKGLDVLIQAFATWRLQDARLRLLIAGEGPERAALQALVAQLGLGSAVEFLGYVDRAPLMQLLATCTMFVLPSRSEPFGIALAEALAAGAPIIASDVGGIPEILEGGAYGLLVRPDDVSALGAAGSQLLGNADLRRKLAASGPPRAAAKFRWEFTGQAYLDLYQNLLTSGPHKG